MIGWNLSNSMSVMEVAMEKLFDELSSGITIHEARQEADPTHLVVWGDHHARLTGVDTASAQKSSNGWWRYE
jgi:hypothetical protein